MAAESRPRHWDAYAARWQLIGPPLRPAATDIEYLRTSVARFSPAPKAALLLGVTPEIAEMAWPPGCQLVAADRSEGMVRAVWPGDTARRRAVVEDWFALEVPEAPFDVVVGDGVFTLLEFPTGYVRLARALGGLVRPGGLLSLRLFCRVAPSEALELVLGDAFAGRVGNFNVFKWRLAMALQGDTTRGVRLADVYRAFVARTGGAPALASRTGWPEAIIGSIEAYRDVDERYSYSTEREVEGCLAQDFELVETWYPSYELGERCPHLSFRRRG
jgi:SAM-dependent methyltransferase